MNWTSVPYETQQDDYRFCTYMNNGLANYLIKVLRVMILMEH